MRALSVPVVLSSVVLTGWLGGARAQDLGPVTRGGSASTASQPAGDQNLEPGVIPQPTIDSPGLVTGFTLGELYTDNLKLAASGKPKQSSWITQLDPFIRAARNGPRFAGVVNYSLTGYLYAGQSGGSQLAQNLDAKGLLTVLPQHLFIDGMAQYGRAIINNQLPTGGGTFFLTQNHANVARGTLSPYWTQQFGDLGTMTLRYSYGRVAYGTRGIPGENRSLLNGIPDFTSNGVQFSFASPTYKTWAWDFSYSDQRLVPDFGPSRDFAVAKLGGSVQVNLNTRLLADVGRENKFLLDGTVDKLGATFWDAGFGWSNMRDSVRAMFGKRFYGSSYQFSWTHEAALLTTSVSYEERPTDLNQQLLGGNGGVGVLPPIGSGVIPSLREQQVFLMKRASASATYLMPKGRLRLNAYDERRTYFTQDNRQEKVANVSLDWMFELGPLTTLTPTLGWQRYQFRDGQVRYNHYGELALVHQVNPKNFGSIKLRHDSSSVASEAAVPGTHGYKVNVIFVQWTHLF